MPRGLAVVAETLVELTKFANIDLFECGHYAVRIRVETKSKRVEIIDARHLRPGSDQGQEGVAPAAGIATAAPSSRSGNAKADRDASASVHISQDGRSALLTTKSIQIKYRFEIQQLDTSFLLRLAVSMSALQRLKILAKLHFELLFHPDQSQDLQPVATKTVSLRGFADARPEIQPCMLVSNQTGYSKSDEDADADAKQQAAYMLSSAGQITFGFRYACGTDLRLELAFVDVVPGDACHTAKENSPASVVEALLTAGSSTKPSADPASAYTVEDPLPATGSSFPHRLFTACQAFLETVGSNRSDVVGVVEEDAMAVTRGLANTLQAVRDLWARRLQYTLLDRPSYRFIRDINERGLFEAMTSSVFVRQLDDAQGPATTDVVAASAQGMVLPPLPFSMFSQIDADIEPSKAPLLFIETVVEHTPWQETTVDSGHERDRSAVTVANGGTPKHKAVQRLLTVGSGSRSVGLAPAAGAADDTDRARTVSTLSVEPPDDLTRSPLVTRATLAGRQRPDRDKELGLVNRFNSQASDISSAYGRGTGFDDLQSSETRRRLEQAESEIDLSKPMSSTEQQGIALQEERHHARLQHHAHAAPTSPQRGGGIFRWFGCQSSCSTDVVEHSTSPLQSPTRLSPAATLRPSLKWQFKPLRAVAPGYTPLAVQRGRAKHLFIGVHGFLGNMYDLRLFKLELQKFAPATKFYLSSANQGKTHDSIETMADRLVEEIKIAISKFRPTHVSFVAHSLGNVVVRHALSRPEVLELFHNDKTGRDAEARSGTHYEPDATLRKPALLSLVSMSAPHLGLVSISSIVRTGMYFMSKWNRSQSIPQLELADRSPALLERLSEAACFSLFHNVVLLGSPQDGYVPAESGLLLDLSGRVSSTSKGLLHRRMKEALLQQLRPEEISGRPMRVVRTQVVFQQLPMVDDMIGRAAHIAQLDCEEFMQRFVLTHLPYLVVPPAHAVPS